MSKLLTGPALCCVLLLSNHVQTQAQTVVSSTGAEPFPIAKCLKNNDDSLKSWTMFQIRDDMNKTVNPGGIMGGSVMEKDNRSDPTKLGYPSPKVEKKTFTGTLDMTKATLPAPVAILVDDLATLTVQEDEGARATGVTGPKFEQTYEVKGSALWMEKSWKEFPVPLPPGRKYNLTLQYENTANLTGKYKGIDKQKVDYDGVSVYVCLQPIDLAVDANRDGQITFDGRDSTSQEKPLRFWINEDDDWARTSDGPTGDNLPALGPDYEGDRIDGYRDLEDFTPLALNVCRIWDQIKSGKIQIGLKWSDVSSGQPAINVFRNVDASNGSNDYLKDREKAIQQAGWESDFGKKLITVGGSQPTFFTQEFIQSLPDGASQINLIFEGAHVGTGKLTLVIKALGHENDSASVNIKLMKVSEMFQSARINEEPGSIPDPWDNLNPPALTWSLDGNFKPDPNEAKQCIVFVHGWRMAPTESDNWAETTYKRLWQLGYKGRFAFFRWPTFSEETHPKLEAKQTYNPSEYRAWLSGPALAAFVNSLPYSNARYLMAHSMGNVISGSALRSGMSVTRYAMLNSAMAAMAYDGTIVDYPDFSTPDTDTEPESKALGLKDKLNPVGTKLINFYLPTDAALEAWSVNNEYFKPQWFFASTYDYSPFEILTPNLIYKKWELLLFPTTRTVTTIPEALSFVTRSRSVSAGADGDTNGSVKAKVGMDAYGFGNQHSSEWVYSIQETYDFWKRLLEEFKIDVTNE